MGDDKLKAIWFHRQYIKKYCLSKICPCGMATSLKHLVQRIAAGTSKLLLLAGFVLLVWGTFAPVGTLVWWLNQSTESLGEKKKQQKTLRRNVPTPTHSGVAINCYIVYLPGVGDYSTNELTPGEEWFLTQLVRSHPNCVAVSDVFPYSAANKDLAGKRLLTPLWHAIEQADGWLENADVLIKIRNLWRFAISADDRYGPVYNQGIADAILERMNAAHPIPDSQQPLNVILIGTSGGVQVALGALTYLDQWLNAQLTVVSMGGTFDGEGGFDSSHHVYHFQGDRDWIDNLSQIAFPSRWPWTINSPFNRARQAGIYTVLDSGNHAHDGQEGYFGLAIAKPNTTYAELTLQNIEQLPIWLVTNAHPTSKMKN